MSADGQRTKRRRNIAENFNRLSRVHERYRQTDRRQTDGRWHNSDVTFAKKIVYDTRNGGDCETSQREGLPTFSQSFCCVCTRLSMAYAGWTSTSCWLAGSTRTTRSRRQCVVNRVRLATCAKWRACSIAAGCASSVATTRSLSTMNNAVYRVRTALSRRRHRRVMSANHFRWITCRSIVAGLWFQSSSRSSVLSL